MCSKLLHIKGPLRDIKGTIKGIVHNIGNMAGKLLETDPNLERHVIGCQGIENLSPRSSLEIKYLNSQCFLYFNYSE